MLTLIWADILQKVAARLATKTLDIPFTILHERFRKIADAASAPPVGNGDSSPQEIWDFSEFPGIPVVAERSDPGSEAVASDDGADGSFAGVTESIPEGAALRRSVRLAKGED